MPSPDPSSADLRQAIQLLHSGRFPQASAALEVLCRRRPNDPEVLLLHGLALGALRRTAEAIQVLKRAIAAAPRLAEAHHQLGNMLKRVGRFDEAVAALRTAGELAPANSVIWLNLGAACLQAEQPREAVVALRHAIALEPQRPEAHNILGVALLGAGQMTEARAALANALQLRPDYAAAHDNLGRLYKAMGQLDDAVLHFRAALQDQPSPITHSNLLLALNYLPEAEPQDISEEHRRWNQLHALPVPRAPTPHASPALTCPAPGRPADLAPLAGSVGRRLRIGYVSPDFSHHAVAYFIEPVLAAHDRSRFEVFCYSNVSNRDRVTQRLEALSEHWRDIVRLDDDTAADLIRSDDIDLLIDLAGHTAGNRLLVLARRPARVQATWIGYPNTTGMDAIDYRLTDSISDPPGQSETWHSEKLVRLPRNFSCYRPDDNAPPVTALPAARSGAVTFGSFNNFAKISPRVIVLWSAVLQRLPKASLFLKSRGLSDPAVVARLRDEFKVHGVAADRVTLNGAELSVPAHLSLYQHVDIGLDPFPYNGTTTTCEALWMGVPVVTLAGRVHASRVGVSLLTQLSLTDWIAHSEEEYVARAVAAAADLATLARLRGTLRERMRLSPLCDAITFTRQFEDACVAMISRAV